MKKAVIYVRTSSMRNVGEDKDSDDRQITKCLTYAEANEIEILTEKKDYIIFYDEGVSGTTDIMQRKEFINLTDYCADNEVDYILVEDISRFSRDAIMSELGRTMLQKAGLDLVPVNAPDLFLNDDKTDPTRRFIRLVLAGIADLERSNIAIRLSSGRRKKRKLKHAVNAKGEGKCGGAKGYHQFDPRIILQVQQIKEMHPTSSLRFVAEVASKQGIRNRKGKPFSATQVRRFLTTPTNILTKEN